MKISHDGKRVSFKTEPKELFEAEESGAKPNTVRILDIDEYHQLIRCNPKKIIIQYRQEIFLRTITHICVSEEVFGKVFVAISWRDENHHHAATRGTVPHGPGDHTQSLDGAPDIPVMPSIHLRSGGKVTGEVTFAMTEGENAPIVGPHSVPVEPGPHNLSPDYVPDVPTTPPICKCANCKGNEIEDDFHVHTTGLDELAPVLLPRTLIHDLGRFRQDGSHADFIRKLLLEHLNKLVEEGGPADKWPNDLHPQIQTKGVEDEC